MSSRQELSCQWKYPPTPFLWRLGELVQGLSVRIEGRVSVGARRFHANFQRGGGHDAAVLFHFNPRFTENCVVRNAKFDGMWGPEEREGALPLRPGFDFQLEISVGADYFFAQFGGSTFCLFSHRRDCGIADTLNVDGDIVLTKVSFKRPVKEVFCPAALVGPGFFGDIPHPPPPYPGKSKVSNSSVKAPSVPLTVSIPGGLVLYRSVAIGLVIKPQASRFKIEFCRGAQKNPPSDVVFHFNPRFVEGEVILNAKFGGAWGPEHRLGLGPFGRGKELDLRFLCGDAGVSVFVDGAFFTTFDHRFHPGKDVNTLHVDGDVILRSVGFL